MTTIPPPFKHQAEDTAFCLANPQVYNASDPGTGKTRTTIDAINQGGWRTLVVAPKSILKAAWGNDIERFAPNLSYSILDAAGRSKGWPGPQADVCITNHDAAKWLQENKRLLHSFDCIVVDEMTAYKHYTAQRTKAMIDIAQHFPRRIALSGTPMPNGPLDLWAQLMILDQGERLGGSYYRYRNAVCEQQGFGSFIKWTPREGIVDAIYGLIGDITIRRKLEDCLDMPENSVHTVEFDPPKELLRFYNEMRQHALLELNEGEVTALNAAAKIGKLLQIASGAVYDSEKSAHGLDTKRYELILDLCEQREQTLVAFTWRHQRDGLIAEAKRRRIPVDWIDGTAKDADRYRAVEDFQGGHTRVLFCHPASAAHGLTLTAGTTTIWASPTYNLEHFEQFNRRAYRAGQTKRTETILVAANGTLEMEVYATLQRKAGAQGSLLAMLETMRRNEDASRRHAA